MRSRNTWTLLTALVALLGCQPEDGATLTEHEATGWPQLDEAGERETQRAIDDAACYCERMYVQPGLGRTDTTVLAVLPATGNVSSYDGRLRSYTARYTNTSGRFQCSSVRASPHGQYLPTRDIDGTDNALDAGEVLAERSWNGCAGASALQSGFCYADFEYCMASELSAMLESASVPVLDSARGVFVIRGGDARACACSTRSRAAVS